MRPSLETLGNLLMAALLLGVSSYSFNAAGATISFDGEAVCTYENPNEEFAECSYWCNSNKVRVCYKENRDECDHFRTVGDRYQCMEAICGPEAAECKCECANKHAENVNFK
jgi:hypothetical protein